MVHFQSNILELSLFKDGRLACLFIVDELAKGNDIKLHLEKGFRDYKMVLGLEQAALICETAQPHIIFIGTHAIFESEHIYLNLIKKVKNLEPHRVVIMVNAHEADDAYKLCKDKVFHDYIIINPLYDKQAFNIAINRSVEVLTESSGSEQLAEIDRTLRNLKQVNEKNKRTEETLQKTLKQIQKELGTTLSSDLTEFQQKMYSDLDKGTSKDEVKQTVSGLTSTLNKSLNEASSDMASALVGWEVEFKSTFEEINSGLSTSIKILAIQRKILVIEDDPFFSKILKSILESGGYLVKTAATGKLGLEKLGYAKPDLVILDWNLPDIAGFEVLKSIKNGLTTGYIPVLILTGHSSPAVVKEAMSLGAANFIVKPSEKSMILSKVEDAIYAKRPG